MVPDISTGDYSKMLCLNCARRIVSPNPTSKYSGLTRYLKFRGSFTNIVELSFAKIDGIIKDNLPMAAYRNEQWWSNSPINVHAKGWLDAGWKVQEVNLKEGHVTFKKMQAVSAKDSKKKRDSNSQIKKPFTPAHVQLLKHKEPSKTKLSKLYARIKNLERDRSSPPAYRGSLKSKHRYEKRMFKSDKKPQ